MTMTFEDAMAHLRTLNHIYAAATDMGPEEAKASFSRTMDAAHVMTARTLTDINSEFTMTPAEAADYVASAAAALCMVTTVDKDTGKRLAAAGMIATADMLVRAT